MIFLCIKSVLLSNNMYQTSFSQASDDFRLMQHLMNLTNGPVNRQLARPVTNSHDTVNVTYNVKFLQLFELNENRQTLEVQTLISMVVRSLMQFLYITYS